MSSDPYLYSDIHSRIARLSIVLCESLKMRSRNGIPPPRQTSKSMLELWVLDHGSNTVSIPLNARRQGVFSFSAYTAEVTSLKCFQTSINPDLLRPHTFCTLYMIHSVITIPGHWTALWRKNPYIPVLCNNRSLPHTVTSNSNNLYPFSCSFLQLGLGLNPRFTPPLVLPKTQFGRPFLDDIIQAYEDQCQTQLFECLCWI